MSDLRLRAASRLVDDSPEGEMRARVEEARMTGYITAPSNDGGTCRLYVAEMPALPWAITCLPGEDNALPSPGARQWRLTHIPTTRRIPQATFTVREARALARALSALAPYGVKRARDDFAYGSPEHRAYEHVSPWIQSRKRLLRDLRALVNSFVP